MTQHHFIPSSKYEAFLVGDDIVKVVAVIKDLKTKDRVLAIQDFNLSSPKINIKVCFAKGLPGQKQAETF